MSMAKTKSEIQREYEKRTNYQSALKYQKEKTSVVAVRLTNSTEQDIIQKLNSVSNKSGYIKALIRADIEKESK